MRKLILVVAVGLLLFSGSATAGPKLSALSELLADYSVLATEVFLTAGGTDSAWLQGYIVEKASAKYPDSRDAIARVVAQWLPTLIDQAKLTQPKTASSTGVRAVHLPDDTVETWSVIYAAALK